MINIIYDNIIFGLQNNGGISVYWYELIKRSLNNNKFEKYYINPDKINKLASNLNFNNCNILTNTRNSSRFLMPDINLNKHIFHSSYFRFNSNKNAINVTTIHDFTHLKYFKGVRKIGHAYFKDRCIKNTDYFITISKNTKNDLLNFYPNINEDKIKVIYNGVSEDYYKLDLNFKTRFLHESEYQKYFLFVGSRSGYKNFENFIIILSRFDYFHLYLVGEKLSISETNLLNKYLANRWKNFSNVDNFNLNILYNFAFALIYPSLYEGFGIPILEAMKAGCPVIALNNSSIPEVAGNAGVILDSLTYSGIEFAIDNIKNNRNSIVNKGLLQSSFFSWDKCYNETIDFYLKIF